MLPDLLTPEGLLEWVELFGDVDESQQLLARFFPPDPNPVPGNAVGWDIVTPSRDIAGFVPYEEKGGIVALPTEAQKTTTAPTAREHSRIRGEYINWMVSHDDRTKAQGRRKVGDALRNLKNRVLRGQELLRAGALKGEISFTVAGVAVTVDVGMDASHIDPSSVDWSTAANDIVTDLRSWKRLIKEDSGLLADTLIVGGNVIGYLIHNTTIQNLLSDKEKDRIVATGTVSRLPGLGLEVIEYEEGYVTGGTYTPYVGDDEAIMVPSAMAGRYSATVQCKTNDVRAAESQRGLFPWSKEEDDLPPAGVLVSMELTAIPINKLPDCAVYDSDVTS